MKFVTKTITYWESEDGRFIIKQAIPSGYAITDTYYNPDYPRQFLDDLDIAMAYCVALAGL